MFSFMPRHSMYAIYAYIGVVDGDGSCKTQEPDQSFPLAASPTVVQIGHARSVSGFGPTCARSPSAPVSPHQREKQRCFWHVFLRAWFISFLLSLKSHIEVVE